MPLEDINTVCPGCKTAFRTGRGLMSHIHQTSNANCRQVFDGYVQLALQFQDPAFSVADNPPSPLNNLSIDDLEALDEDLPHSEAEAADDDMVLDEDDESLSGIHSDGAEIEADLQFEIGDEDIEVTSMPDTDNEDEGEEYLW